MSGIAEPDCGSILFLYEDGLDEVEVAAGSIEEQHLLLLGEEIWTHERPGWVPGP